MNLVTADRARPPGASAVLELRDLAIRAPGRVLVDGVNIDVHPGAVTALCGPSGAGKSLTARACMGVLDVSPGLFRGSLRFPALSSKDWFADVVGKGARAQATLLRESESLRGGYLSYSPQAASSALNPGRTIGRQIEMAIARRATPVPAADLGGLIRELLDEVGLQPYVATSLPGELSGGMCQRAALAIAIAPDPRVLLADEPETGLDPVLRRQIVELLVQVGKAHSCGILLISHHEDTVERIADNVIRLTPVHGGGE
ncbi:MAG: ATP-binding cassette domain-containing protein [Pseudomonadota bacterium]|nr:ATP-binding cassette domain-containing protein [Pseudomonadota bacterium]